jgi:HEAT repeat protein
MKRLLVLTAPALLYVCLALPANCQTPGDDDRARTLLTHALQAKNPDIRKEGVKALRLVAGQEPYTTTLESMLRDPDVPVRLAVVAVLAGLKNERAVGSLNVALDDTVPEVRFAAATALCKLQDPAGRDYLLKIMSGKAKPASGMVAERLREAKRMLETPQTLMVLALKQGIGFVPVPYLSTGFDVLHEVMSHGTGSSRASTALVLAKTQDPQVVAVLRVALHDKDCFVRAAAVQGLAMADSDSHSLFVPLFNDKSRPVRLLAAAGYLRMNGASSASTFELASN